MVGRVALTHICEKSYVTQSEVKSESESEPQHPVSKETGEAEDESRQIDLEECIAKAGSLR